MAKKLDMSTKILTVDRILFNDFNKTGPRNLTRADFIKQIYLFQNNEPSRTEVSRTEASQPADRFPTLA